MDRAFDEIVIGGGVAGAALAWFLAQPGRRVALLEAGVAAGEGATRASGGLVRAYDPDDVLLDLSLRGALGFGRWHELGLPGPSPLARTGLLYIGSEATADRMEARARGFSQRGYGIELLSHARASRLAGAPLAPRGGAYLFECDAGAADVRLTVRSLLHDAAQRGLTFLEHCPVESWVEDARHVEVRTPQGVLHTQRVIAAAGVHTARFFPQLGLYARTIPLSCVRFAGAAPSCALIDEHAGTYLRPSGSAVWCGSQEVVRFEPGAPPPCGCAQAADSLARLRHVFAEPPALELVTGVMGWDAYSADQRPFAGPMSARSYVLGGFSGRGFKFALPLAAAVARELLGQSGYPHELTADLSMLRPARTLEQAS